MNLFLLDTNIASHIIRQDDRQILEFAYDLPAEALAISAVTKGELIFGLAKIPRREEFLGTDNLCALLRGFFNLRQTLRHVFVRRGGAGHLNQTNRCFHSAGIIANVTQTASLAETTKAD